MFGEGSFAQLDAGIEHIPRVERLLDLHKEIVEFCTEHGLDELGTNTAVAMFTANRAAKSIQHCGVDFLIGAHHLLEVAGIVYVQQGDDVRISISDMAEDRHRHALPFEEVFKVSD